MKKLILILFCISIYSCCNTVNFKEKDKNWFSNYNIGDKLIYKSQLNDFDTIFITNKILKKPKGDCNILVSNYEREFVRVDYEIKKDTFELLDDYFIQMSANEELENAVPVIRFLNMEFSYQELPELDSSMSNPKWNNIYIFNRSNSEIGLNGLFEIIELEWDINYGLVSYENESGEKWELIKKE